ncbi:MAG: sialate O-acetylesterase [Pseudobacter sp.]|uniref:sialate O-acetylesterase n=1 Tax=Pseudobacter sp. TaxID=2045420 RepID=UPI003F7FBB7B
MKKILFLLFALQTGAVLQAQVKLPRLIRDSMILQRDDTVQLWGWASTHEKVTARFNGKQYRTNADTKGNWSIKLPPTPAGGPYTIDITGKNKISIREVLFGDVWFCSGQSNMVHQLNIHDVTYAKDIAGARFPQIRQFLVPAQYNLEGPQKDLSNGHWQPAIGDAVRPFSAVAFFFAKKLYEKYKVPIGIINASVGGTPVEAWTSEAGLSGFPSMLNTILKNKDTAYINSILRQQADNRTALPADAGLNTSPKWFDPSCIPRGWRNINIPGYWEDQGLKDLNGVVWYRREIELPPSMANNPARVFLGRIVDADELYINGVRVGNTTYMYPQRRYTVPAGILKAGKNIFVVRVTNNYGKGGFVPDKPYCIFAGKDTIDLKGDWQYKVGVAFKPNTGNIPGINFQKQPSALFNAMVAPIIPYRIKGFCWYQGESNEGQPDLYGNLMHAQVNDWRTQWAQGQLPFLFVQLPGFMDYNYFPTESNWALLREAQLHSLRIPNTGMAVAIDLGEWNDIHPDNKKDVGERLALSAMKVAYKEDIIYSGPIYDSYTIKGNAITIYFKHTGSGLVTNDGEPLSDFAIAGADKKFVWARTRIEGNTVIVWSDEITAPEYVRYAWSDNPVNPNLFNKEGLPASPFRTDH